MSVSHVVAHTFIMNDKISDNFELITLIIPKVVVIAIKTLEMTVFQAMTIELLNHES